MRARQVIIAFGTLLALAIGYIFYVSTFGKLTDFPQLAAELRTPMPLDGSQESTKSAVRESEVAAVRGFGPNCSQISAPLILESRRNGEKALPTGRGVGMFVFADTYEIPPENQNQIRLKPFSLVNITESKDGNPDHDEIMTVFAEQAILEFDRPIELTKLSGLHPLVGWVQGDVTLKTNRRTVDPSDDIVVFTERLHYDRAKQLIWADNTVKIVVEKEGTITGDGLEVELYSEEEQKKEKEKKRSEAKSAKLLKNVRFDLLLSSNEDFLGGAPNGQKQINPEAALENKTRDRTSVVIQARGPFTYDMEQNFAKFDNSVQVLRRNPSEKKDGKDSVDQLEADQLTMSFKNGPADSATPKPTGENENALAVDQVIATGSQVILLSESQKLQATGNRLEFNGSSHTVTLQGEKEMIAVKDNAVIHAQKFHLVQDSSGKSKLPQQIIADGPEAWMDLIEATPQAPADMEKGRRLHISWQDKLVMTRKADSEAYEFVITGGVELEHESAALTCKQMQGLLVPIEDPAAPGVAAKKRYEPLRLEAEGNVSFHSDKVDVGAETLIMHILNRRPAIAEAPAAKGDAPAVDKGQGVAAKAEAPGPNTPQPAPKKKTESKDALAEAQVRKPEEEESSMNLTARTVTIVVEKIGSNSRPVSAWAEGGVKVSQPPRKPGDRPLEIVGNLLEYERKSDGDVMTIKGTDKSFAEVRSADMLMAARHSIVLNESTNRVEIAGPGYLTMKTATTLSGEKTVEPTPARVEWDDLMNFDGRNAYFEGKVVATQKTAEMHSHTMEVTFDRKIEFKKMRDGSKESKEQPAVESVYCERDVQILNREIENEALVRQTRVLSNQLRYDNVERQMMIDGAGNITIVEPSKPKKDNRGRVVPPELPFRVTIVEFGERMTGEDVSKTIKFFGGVKIVSVPVADPGKAIDESALPDEGFIINSNHAEMGVTQDQTGKKFQLFNASDNVEVEAREYRATCGRLGFDELKGWLVLDGERDRAARLYRQTKAGQAPESFAGRTIRLNPATKEIRTDGSEGINSLELGRPTRPAPERR